MCASKGEDAFVTRGYTNWKDASGDKRGGFVKHERSQFHKYCVDLTMKTHKDVGESLSSQHEKEKEINCAYLRKVLKNITFLARQGLPMRGNGYPHLQMIQKVVVPSNIQIFTSLCFCVQRMILLF